MEKSLPHGKVGWTLIMSEFGPRPFRRGWREPRQGGIQATGREGKKKKRALIAWKENYSLLCGMVDAREPCQP